MDAFRDHGTLEQTLTADLDGAKHVLAEADRLGLDLPGVTQELVEETGEISLETGGRPAKLFRLRGELQAERAVSGTKLPLLRS